MPERSPLSSPAPFSWWPMLGALAFLVTLAIGTLFPPTLAVAAPTGAPITAPMVIPNARGVVTRYESPVLVMARRAESRVLAVIAQLRRGPEPRVIFLETSTPAWTLAWVEANNVAVLDINEARDMGLNEAEVAWILAHEFAHVILNHTGSRALLEASQSPRETQVAFWQTQEREADELATGIVRAAGYTNFDAQSFFIKMRKGPPAEHVGDSHPSDVERIERMRVALPATHRGG